VTDQPEHPEDGIVRRAEEWLHGHDTPAPAVKDPAVVAAALAPLLSPHLASVLAHAARVLGDPQLKALWPDVLDLAFGALQIAGVAL
jgi:hypothetical protein